MILRKDFCKMLIILMVYFLQFATGQCEQATRVGIVPLGIIGKGQEFLWLSEALTTGIYGDLSRKSNLSVVDREEMNIILQHLKQDTSLQTGKDFMVKLGTTVNAGIIIGGALSVKNMRDIQIFIQIHKFVPLGEKNKIHYTAITLSGHIDSLINLRTNLRTAILKEFGLTPNGLIPIEATEDTYRDYAKACYFFSLGEYDKSLSFCSKAVVDSSNYVEAKMKLADLYFIKGDYGKAVLVCQDILRITDKDDDLYLEADVNMLMGDCFRLQGKTTDSETVYQKAFSLYEKLGHQPKIASALSGIAVIKLVQGQKEDALSYYKKSIEVFRKLGDRSAVIAIAVGIANIYRDTREYKSSIKFLSEAFEFARTIGDKESQFSIRYDRGLVHQAAGDWEDALTEFSEAGCIAQEIKSSVRLWLSQIGIMQTYISQGSPDKAISFYESVLSQKSEGACDKESLEACIQIGNTLLEKKYCVEARDLFKSSIERCNSNELMEQVGIIYFGLGLAECNIGNRNSAKAAFEKSCSIFHEIKSPREALALKQIEILFKNGKYP